MRRSLLPVHFLILLLSLSQSATADNWPQWRGAKLNGISQEEGIPTEWSNTKNVAWRVKLPGAAGSTPVVWDDRIFLTSVANQKDLVLICINHAGSEVWRNVVGSGDRSVRGDEGNMASPSPCTDGKYVWACMANGYLACYTVEGKPVWDANLEERYGKYKIAFGMSATPVLDRGRLYLQLIHGEGNPKTREAKVVCLNAADGKEIWQHDRASDARAECEHSYASPMLYRNGDREFLVTHGADYVMGHSLEDGSEIWRCGELNPKANYNPTLRFVASPLCAPGLIVVPSAKNGPVFALKADIKGDVTDDKNAFYWQTSRGTPDVPSPLYHDGLVYLCRENGNLNCFDAKTGEKVYENQRTVRARHRASPVFADGKIYVIARDQGIVTVVKAGRDFEILASNKMGEAISASPAIANGRIYLRSFDALYAIGK